MRHVPHPGWGTLQEGTGGRVSCQWWSRDKCRGGISPTMPVVGGLEKPALGEAGRAGERWRWGSPKSSCKRLIRPNPRGGSVLRARSPTQQLCRGVTGHPALQPRTPTGVNCRRLLAKGTRAGLESGSPSSRLRLGSGSPDPSRNSGQVPHPSPHLGPGPRIPAYLLFPCAFLKALRTAWLRRAGLPAMCPREPGRGSPAMQGSGPSKPRKVPTSKMKSGTWGHGRPFFRGAGRGRREADLHAENPGRKGSSGGFLHQRIEVPPNSHLWLGGSKEPPDFQ